MLMAPWGDGEARRNTAWLSSPFQLISSLSLVSIKVDMLTVCPRSSMVALGGGNGGIWLMLLLITMILCLKRMGMVVVVMLGLGVVVTGLGSELLVMVGAL